MRPEVEHVGVNIGHSQLRQDSREYVVDVGHLFRVPTIDSNLHAFSAQHRIELREKLAHAHICSVFFLQKVASVLLARSVGHLSLNVDCADDYTVSAVSIHRGSVQAGWWGACCPPRAWGRRVGRMAANHQVDGVSILES